MIQGGDPKGDGAGGPGYWVVEAPPKDLVYEQGRGGDGQDRPPAPGTSGSRFFVVTAEDAGCRPTTRCSARSHPGQTSWSRSGSTESDPSTEQPLDPIVIQSVKVNASSERALS